MTTDPGAVGTVEVVDCVLDFDEPVGGIKMLALGACKLEGI